MEEACRVAKEMAKQSRSSLMFWKQCMNSNYPHPIMEPSAIAARMMNDFRPHHDAKEAVDAFLEQRPPEYDDK
jgi:enoyl-CoA hydratase/carnithine racemase